MTNVQLSLIKPEERTPDGNLLPEARARIIHNLKTYLQQTGVLNVSELSLQLGLARQTTRRLVDEVARAWQDELRYQFMAQTKWYQEVFRDTQEHPDAFSKDKIALVKLQSSLLSKVNSLMKVLILK
ncbi:MAG: hypothetical protein V1685_01705 [Parcubacteria group bacterium]